MARSGIRHSEILGLLRERGQIGIAALALGRRRFFMRAGLVSGEFRNKLKALSNFVACLSLRHRTTIIGKMNIL